LLVGGFNPSEKYQSVGIITPNIWKNVPNHHFVHHFVFRAALVKRKQPDFRGVSVSVPAGQGTDKPLQTTETRLPNSRR